MVKKQYTEKAFDDVINTLKNDIQFPVSVDVLAETVVRADKEFPGLKNTFIHDMGSFLTHWHELVNDSISCSSKLRSKILSLDMIGQYSDFNNYAIFCYDIVNEAIDPVTNKPYVNNLLSYLGSVVKAVVQTKRRSLGFDTNSKKFTQC